MAAWGGRNRRPGYYATDKQVWFLRELLKQAFAKRVDHGTGYDWHHLDNIPKADASRAIDKVKAALAAADKPAPVPAAAGNRDDADREFEQATREREHPGHLYRCPTCGQDQVLAMAPTDFRQATGSFVRCPNDAAVLVYKGRPCLQGCSPKYGRADLEGFHLDGCPQTFGRGGWDS
jgi:hypothetical protein